MELSVDSTRRDTCHRHCGARQLGPSASTAALDTPAVRSYDPSVRRPQLFLAVALLIATAASACGHGQLPEFLDNLGNSGGSRVEGDRLRERRDPTTG